MRYVKYIIDQVRKQTENDEFTDFTGIQDSEFIQYINDAQHSLQAMIVQQHPRVFIKEKVINAVNDQEKYALPDDCYLGNKVHNVEYSPTGLEDDYYVLEEDTIKRRTPGVSGSPVKYIRMAGELLLTPQPQSSSATIRLNYVQRIREIDLRRALVSAPATSSSSTTWTISLDNGSLSTDTESLQEHDYVCVVDKEGKTIAANIPVNQISATTLTLDPVSESVSVLAGHYIVGGKDASTHGDFDRSVERYIISYCAFKILKRDSSVDATEAQMELQNIATEIIKSYANITDDIQLITQLNSWDDWSV